MSLFFSECYSIYFNWPKNDNYQKIYPKKSQIYASIASDARDI